MSFSGNRRSRIGPAVVVLRRIGDVGHPLSARAACD
ncbi:hypothetical protein ACVIGB_002892 [Bradyrhizobium sp. USDA 4341]